MSGKRASLLFFIHLAVLTTAVDLMAEPIERKHDPVFLGMPLSLFMEKVKHEEGKSEVGQFREERRFHADPSRFSAEVQGVVCDFYKERLFRIEINYRPIPKARAQEIQQKLSHQYGAPRRNILDRTEILFWDDGATRLIFQREAEEDRVDYSITYLDDLLFHQASRERVQKEITP
jgi:hypothetical protein